MLDQIKKVFAGELGLDNFDPGWHTHVRAYHACRPVEVSAYFEKGIKIFSEPELLTRASAIFEITLKEVEEVAKKRRKREKRQEIDFALVKATVFRDCHYLCYGSEYILDLAAGLDGATCGKYHTMLVNKGIPTIFICDVPVEHMQDKDIEELRGINELGDEWTISLGRDLPSECIIGHEHPGRLIDPISKCEYINNKSTCPYCEEVP